VPLERSYVPNLSMDKIEVSPCNIRKHDARKGLDSLKESLNSRGLLQPVTVVGPQNDGKYELIMGQRRFLAAKDLGWKEIDAIVIKPPIDDVMKIELSLSENIQSQEPFEGDVLEAFSTLYKKYHKVTEIQKILGISTAKTHDLIWLNEAPEEIRKLIGPKVLPTSKAADIVKAGYPDKQRMIELADVFLSGRLTTDEKKRLLEAAKVHRDMPVAKLEEEAKKPPEEYKVILLLPPEHYERLGTAAENRGFDRSRKSELSDFARFTVIEWLDEKGF
jgi:ParB family chromosome partitioning protein